MAVLSACRADDPFVCDSDAQCVRSGLPAGKCEASRNCSFPDIDCTSTGRRYDDLANHSGECVLDEDQDMIADDGDNCPGMANAEQYDEDNDERGDICDPCPPFGELLEGAGDDDGDGVGNLCDPNPMGPNSILFFEGFHTPLSPMWSVTGGGALVENDGLVLQNTADATLPVMSGGTEVLTVGVRMAAAPTIGVFLGLPYNASGGAYCELTTAKLQLWAIAAPNKLLSEAAYNAKVDKDYIYSIHRGASMQYRCAVRAGATTVAVETMGTSLVAPTSAAIHIGTDATTRFPWVMLVKN